MNDFDLRHVPFEICELRAAEGGGRVVIEALAVPFASDSRSDMGFPAAMGFTERIMPTALDAFLAESPEVLALVNHDPKHTLGRKSVGTLQLTKEARGIRAVIFPGRQSWALDALESVRRGDYAGMSFKITHARDRFVREKDGRLVRYIDSMRMPEVSIVTEPTYLATTVSASTRSALERAERELPVGRSLALAEAEHHFRTVVRDSLAATRYSGR